MKPFITKSGKVCVACFSLSLSVCVVLFFCLFLGAFGQSIAFSPDSETASGGIYYLVLGVDDAATGGGDRTDMIGIIGIDFDHSRSVFLSVPRDLMVEEPRAYESSIEASATTTPSSVTESVNFVKINSLYKKYGVETLRSVLERTLKICLSRYAIVDYQMFEYLGDLLGPVKINVRTTLEYEDTQQNMKIHFAPGIHEMYGKELLLYVRFRNDPLGDLGRIQRQKEAIVNLLQALKRKKDAYSISQLIRDVLSRIETDINPADALLLWKYSSVLEGLSFLNFPYTINEKGAIQIAEDKLKRVQEEMSSMSPHQEPYVPQLVVINAWNDNTYQFSVVEYNVWSSRGLRPFIVEQRFTHSAIDERGTKNDVIVLLVNEKEKQDEIVARYKEVYSGKTPLCYYPGIGSPFSFKDFLSVIDAMLKNKIAFSYPVDAFIYRTNP